MAKVQTSTLSRLAKKIFGDVPEVPQIVHEGRKALYSGEGTHSLVLWPFMTAIKKLKGEKVINEAIYSKYLRKLKNADERAGRILAQHGPSERLFSIRETVPTKRKVKGLPAKVEHETYAATAPVSKTMKVVTPLAAGMFLSEKVSPSQEKTGAQMDKNPKALMKQAADAIDRYRRREEAVKLAFAMVEKGKCEPFESLAAFQEKVASLLDKNLDAVAEALEMDAELSDFGKVASEKTNVAGGSSAEMNFFHRLSE